MPGDELNEEAGGSVKAAPDAGHARTGARHAAPRKHLLNRLHVPAGKAIAIAAMPSAVLMGMGLTPQLANAKPMPKNPFKSGPCVSQEDRENAEEQKEREKEQKADAAKAEKAKEAARKKIEAAKKKQEQDRKAEAAGKSGTDSGSTGSGDSGSDSGSGSADSGTSDSGTQDSGTQDSGTQDSGTQETEKKDPLDPLGLGDALHDTFTPDDKQDTQDQETKSGTDAAGSADSSGTDSGSGASDSPTKPVEDTVNKVGDGVKDTTDKLGDGVKDTTDKVGKEVGKTQDKLPAVGANKADESGKKAFPCVEEKKTDGKDEQTPATLPDDPWELQSSKLSLHGLNYEGVVNVKTANGSTKQTLKFTADSIDIKDLHQIVQGPAGTKTHVRTPEGSNSTVDGGKVTMYTDRLQGNLFGLIPVVFDPEHPPPLNVPEAVFTKVKVTQAGQFGGNLTVPGLKTTVE